MQFIDTSRMNLGNLVPHHALIIDISGKQMLDMIGTALRRQGPEKREEAISALNKLWMKGPNKNPVLPILCVRTAFDLYLRIMNFPIGSEIIVSAFNIPDMVSIMKHHHLKIVSWDIEIDTAAPKLNLLESLITPRTVAILVAHIYGKLLDIDPIIDIANQHNIPVLEDCAEVFTDFDHNGNPRSEICFFSFGVIKFYSSFGGGIAKVRRKELYDRMKSVYNTYPTQTQSEYLKKMVQYSFAGCIMNSPLLSRITIGSFGFLGLDHQTIFVAMLRAFPKLVLERVRKRPCTALLCNMVYRQENYSFDDFNLCRVKGEYVKQRLPESVVVVGGAAPFNNYWLFPIVVQDPDTFVRRLNLLGIEAHRSASQLYLVESTNGDAPLTPPPDLKYPHEAKYLIDNIVYLPINKHVPFHLLDHIIKGMKHLISIDKSLSNIPNVKIQSKL